MGFRGRVADQVDRPTFNATANEVAIDTLEITHEGLDRTK